MDSGESVQKQIIFWHNKMPAQVVRRTAYKGERPDGSELVLPVDCATIPGALTFVASFLLNRSLTADAQKQTWALVELFDKMCDFAGEVRLLRRNQESTLKVESNRILLEDWSSATAAIGLDVLAQVDRVFGL